MIYTGAIDIYWNRKGLQLGMPADGLTGILTSSFFYVADK